MSEAVQPGPHDARGIPEFAELARGRHAFGEWNFSRFFIWILVWSSDHQNFGEHTPSYTTIQAAFKLEIAWNSKQNFRHNSESKLATLSRCETPRWPLCICNGNRWGTCSDVSNSFNLKCSTWNFQLENFPFETSTWNSQAETEIEFRF